MKLHFGNGCLKVCAATSITYGHKNSMIGAARMPNFQNTTCKDNV